MYDGTIVPLAEKPAMHGDAYYTRKGNYGLNVQIGNTPSNLRIIDYSHGFTGSAHDASAFEHTAAFKYPQWFFAGEEFAWADSAYTLSSRCIPVHKKPANLIRENRIFDKTVSNIRVRSEHCMGALKQRFQCLNGLRIKIRDANDHIKALQWITVAIILHNFVIDVEGDLGHNILPPGDAEEDNSGNNLDDYNGEEDMQVDLNADGQAGEAKRQRLIAELMEYRQNIVGIN